MPLNTKSLAEDLAFELLGRLRKSTMLEWSVWRWKNEREGVVEAIEESVKNTLDNTLKQHQYQLLSDGTILESLTKTFLSKEVIANIASFLAAEAPSVSPHGIQEQQAKTRYLEKHQEFIQRQVNKAIASAMGEEEKAIKQSISQIFLEAAREETSEPADLYGNVFKPAYSNMRAYYNERDGVAEAIGELIISKVNSLDRSIDAEYLKNLLREKINTKEVMGVVEGFLAENARKSLISGIGKDAAKDAFLEDDSICKYVNGIIEQAIQGAAITPATPSLEEDVAAAPTLEETGEQDHTEDEDPEIAIVPTPVLERPNFNISYDAFIKKTKIAFLTSNGQGQNCVHDFISNPKMWESDLFKSLLTGKILSEARKNKLRELVDSGDEHGMTPMHYAAIKGDMKWLEALGGDLIKADKNSKTPIDYILDRDNPVLLGSFISICLGGDINKDLGERRDGLGEGTTLAHCIARHPLGFKYKDILVGHEADLKARNIHGDTPLMIAASSGKIKNMYGILDATNEMRKSELELLQMRNNQGKEAIHLLVAARPETDFVHLKHLAELQSVSGLALGTLDANDNNIAHILAEAKNASELLRKIELKPLLTARNKLGQTPIHVLLNHQRQTNSYLEEGTTKPKERDRLFLKQIEEFLRANPELLLASADSNGDSLLHYVARNGYSELLPVLKELKATVESLTNHRGQAPLHLAAMYGHDEMVAELLKEYPGLINTQDKYGNTALHYAAINGSIETIKKLAFAGADPYILNKAGTDKDEKTGKYKPMETVFDILDKYKGKAGSAEDDKITSAMAILALNAGVSDGLKKHQKKRVDKALEKIGEELASKLYEVVKTAPENQMSFTDKIIEIATELSKDKRPINADEREAFSKQLDKALQPVYENMKKFEAAKNYTTKYKWNLVMRLVDCISNTFVIAGYKIWGLGNPEKKILYTAKKVVTAKLDDLSKGRFKPDKDDKPAELFDVLKRARKLRPQIKGVTHHDGDTPDHKARQTRRPRGLEKS